MTSLPLIFDAPRKAKPPRHLADLSPSERRAAVTELGEKPFRADQLSGTTSAGWRTTRPP